MSFKFDLTEVEEDKGGGPIPPGSYLAEIEEVDLKDTNDGKGKYISVQFTITDNKQNGRKFWEMYNVINENEETVNIALSKIKSLIIASGGSPGLFNDEEALLGLECIVKLGIKREKGYDERNKIVSYSAAPNDNGAAGESLPFENDEKPTEKAETKTTTKKNEPEFD